jgi:hypothetical protein
MTQNLKELPKGEAVNATQWLATEPGDLGFYGYHNITNQTGSAGWGTSETNPNEGLLYQWSAAMMGATHERAKGICPTGWHIPSDCEFTYLEHGLGMSLLEQERFGGFRADGSDAQGLVGNKLRATGSTGFSMLLVGFRGPTGGFLTPKNYSVLWTSSQRDANSTIEREFNGTSKGNARAALLKSFGLSVRCLKD